MQEWCTGDEEEPEGHTQVGFREEGGFHAININATWSSVAASQTPGDKHTSTDEWSGIKTYRRIRLAIQTPWVQTILLAPGVQPHENLLASLCDSVSSVVK